MSSKFDALAVKAGSERLAGWITQHNPTVKARAEATKAKKKRARKTAREMMGRA